MESIDIQNININTTLNSKWNLWYHYNKNDWTINGYKLLYTISTINDFWNFYQNIDLIGGFNNQHFFLMRDNIHPLWEDKNNINGGCWSYKKNINLISDLWTDISIYLIGETLYNEPLQINGISICMKKGKNSIIKIWTNSCEVSLNNLNKFFTTKWIDEPLFTKNIK